MTEYIIPSDYGEKLANVLPDGILTFLTDGQVIHINLEAQRMLNINASASESYQNHTLYIGDVFRLIYREKDLLPGFLEELRAGRTDIELPHDCCVQEKATNITFPVKGRFFVFQAEKNYFEVIFYFHNTTPELTQEYILNTALLRTKIYPWFLDIDRGVFVLDARYFEYLGIQGGAGNTLTMEEYNEMVHPEDRERLTNAFAVQFSGNRVYDKPVDFRLRRGDGSWEWFEGQSTYIGRLSGLPYRLVGICMSIQEHKNVEETLIAARRKAEESDRLKSAFLANMSHEIRTPLNAIVGFSEVLATSYEQLLMEERKEYVDIIKKNSTQLLVLISDILDLSKIESNNMEFKFSVNSLNDICKDVFRIYEGKIIRNVNLEFFLPEEVVWINTDSVRLKQVLNNLINNAIKFTAAGYVRFGFQRGEGDTVELFVEDSGSGISPEDLKHVFDRFYKADSFKQGTGLGLSICKTIVENLKGNISITSELHHGTKVKISLPMDAQEDRKMAL